jgi:hypothetical protein
MPAQHGHHTDGAGVHRVLAHVSRHGPAECQVRRQELHGKRGAGRAGPECVWLWASVGVSAMVLLGLEPALDTQHPPCTEGLRVRLGVAVWRGCGASIMMSLECDGVPCPPLHRDVTFKFPFP